MEENIIHTVRNTLYRVSYTGGTYKEIIYNHPLTLNFINSLA